MVLLRRGRLKERETVNHKERRRGQRSSGYLMVALASLLFGFNGNLARRLFDAGITPVTLVELRMLIGGGCLLVLLLLTQSSAVKLPRHMWGWTLGLGLAMAAVTYSYFMAISRLPIAIALVIQFSTPAWLVLGEALWRRRWPSRYMLSALALAFSGIVLVTGAWQQRLAGLDGPGLLYAFFSILTFAAYLLLGERVGRELPALTSTTWSALIAALFWLVIQPPWMIPAATWQPILLLVIVAVGIMGMALPFLLELAALRYLDAARAGITAMLELVAGSVIAYCWLGQILTGWQVVGSGLVLAGVTLLHYESARRRSRGQLGEPSSP